MWLILIVLVGAFLFAMLEQRRLARRVERLEAEIGIVRALAEARRAAPEADMREVEPAPEAIPERRAPLFVERAADPIPARTWAEDDSFRDEADGADEADEAPSQSLSGWFEQMVGGRLLIWVGGAALVLAAVFLIRHSIEIGLVTPELRMIGAALFGLVLLGAGEYARRGRFLAEDPRVAQALVGAGLAVLYAAAYGSHILYGLIGAGLASALMLAITLAALGLSLRHGAPTAAMGLIGGFLSPLLIGNADAGAVPLLVYLGFLNAAIFALAWSRGWPCLAAAAVAGSFLWTGALSLAPAIEPVAIGLFVIALCLAAALARPPGTHRLALAPATGLGLVQVAIVTAAAPEPLGWLLYLLLAGAAMALAALRREQLYAAPLALALLLVLLADAGAGAEPALAAAAGTLLFGGAGAALARRGDRLVWTGVAAAGIAGPALLLRLATPALLARPAWGALFLALAAAAAAIGWSQRRHASEAPGDLGLLAAAGAAAALAAAAAYDLLPGQLLVAAWLIVAVAAALAARRLRDGALAMIPAVLLVAAGLRALAMVPELGEALATALLGMPVLTEVLPPPAAAGWALLLPAALLALLWAALPAEPAGLRRSAAILGGAFATLGAYILFKQMFGLADRDDFVARGFAERTAITQALFLAGWLLAGLGVGRRWLGADQLAVAGTALTAFAAVRLVWFDMLVLNPWVAAQHVGALPVLNLLLPAYLLGAFWLYAARRRATRPGAAGLWLILSLASLGLGALLMVRQSFQGPILTGPGMPLAEFYLYSLAGLLVSMLLMGAGVRLPDKGLRVAGLAALTLTILKVFLVDASELEGVLRILSFLGLGIALIGIGKLYGTVLKAERGRER
ncbi:MAG: DUF2339 domain-containing protein [Allosphingosinicella sp.]|uniref:DUF2339 domain-containing protein n=1 Tax=Allosphingosinicella sp. TaxID=2823234 RepID=UPI0039326D49